jgi:hypothetical protein
MKHGLAKEAADITVEYIETAIQSNSDHGRWYVALRSHPGDLVCLFVLLRQLSKSLMYTSLLCTGL